MFKGEDTYTELIEKRYSRKKREYYDERTKRVKPGKRIRHCYQGSCINRITKNNEIWCGDCGRVSYCSTKCQLRDILHKKNCFPTLPERLRSVCEILLKSGVCNNLSNSFTPSPFTVYGDGYDIMRIFCVICDSLIVENEKLLKTEHELNYVYHNSHLWEYYTCSYCTKEGKRLCPTYLMSNDKCRSMNIRELKKKWFFLNSIIPNQDVQRIILFYMMKLIQCQNCLYIRHKSLNKFI